MKKILNLLSLDIQLIFRDKIMSYVLFFPAIMAAILLLVSSSIGNTTPTLAIEPALPPASIAVLEQVANLELQRDKNSLFERVKAFDRVAGITWHDDAAHIIFQGNEGSAYQNQITDFIANALNKNLPNLNLVNMHNSRHYIITIIIAALLLAPVLVGGAVSGFLIVSDKENNLIRGYQISPIRLSTYMIAKSILAIGVGACSMLILSAICGISAKINGLTLILLSSLPLFGVITILFSSMAKDKISCIALFKILVLIFLVLPLASAFVPNSCHPVFYPLPMYWQFQSLMHVLTDSPILSYCGLTFLLGFILLIFTAWIFRNKIQKL